MTLNDAARSFADYPSPTTEQMARPWPLVWNVAPIPPWGPMLYDDLIGPEGQHARVFGITYPPRGFPTVQLASHDHPDREISLPLEDVRRDWARAA